MEKELYNFYSKERESHKEAMKLTLWKYGECVCVRAVESRVCVTVSVWASDDKLLKEENEKEPLYLQSPSILYNNCTISRGLTTH